MLVLLVDIGYIYLYILFLAEIYTSSIGSLSGGELLDQLQFNYSSIKFDLNIIYFSGHVTCRAGIISIIDQIGVFYL